MKMLKLIGYRIKQERLKKNISQEKLAEISSLHRTFIGGIERGERNISINTLLKITTALGIPIESVFRFNENKKI